MYDYGAPMMMMIYPSRGVRLSRQCHHAGTKRGIGSDHEENSSDLGYNFPIMRDFPLLCCGCSGWTSITLCTLSPFIHRSIVWCRSVRSMIRMSDGISPKSRRTRYVAAVHRSNWSETDCRRSVSLFLFQQAPTVQLYIV